MKERAKVMRHLARRSAKLALVLVVACAICPAAEAATYYVDFQDGSDAASGTSPRAAFTHCPGDEAAEGTAAGTALAPGDTVLFKGGVHYRGHLAMKWSGAKGKPITYDGNTAGTFGRGPAIIDGADPVTGWRRCASARDCGGNPNYRNIWTATVPTGVKGLAAFTAGLMQSELMLYPAQYPSPDDPFYGDKLNRFLKLGTGMRTTSITDPRLEEIGGPKLVGGYACVFVVNNDMHFVPIAGYDAASKTITFGRKTRQPAGYYAVANSLSPKVFDRAGEYVFVDKPDADGRHRVYLWPWGDKDPNKTGIGYVARTLGVNMGTGNHHVTLRGFRIQDFQEALRVRGANGVVIRDNVITRIRQTGFANACNASRVNDFTFADNYAHEMPKMRTMVTHTGQRVAYSGNRVHRGGRSPLVFYNIKVGRIVGNHITDCRGMHSNAISIYVGCRDILVARNEVHNSNIALTLQNAERISVVGNLFTGSGSLIGLWPGTPHRDHVFVGNLLYSPTRSVYVNSRDVERCTFKNNILALFDGFTLDESNTLSHNLYLNRPERLAEGEFVVADESTVFVNAAKGDFHLVPTGPAVDMGTDIAALLPRATFPDFDFSTGFGGGSRVFGPGTDIGPYEAKYPAGALTGRKPIPTGRATAAAPRFKRIKSRQHIVIPALEFAGQGGGQVTPIAEATCGFETIVRYWNPKGHWLEYTVDAPAAGDYTVGLRYTSQFDAPRQVIVNGRPARGYESVKLPATGGWKHFKDLTLPGKVTLRKGRNTIRLVSLGGRGCNLDRLTLAGPGGPRIDVSAGRFTGQGGGKVEVVPSPRHGLFAMWNAEGHWLEWTVKTARAGRHELRIRYATLASSPRQVSLNGEVVKGLEAILLPRTNGWRRCEEVSLPGPLVLKEGRNVLRLTSLGGGGMNLDEIRLIPVE